MDKYKYEVGQLVQRPVFMDDGTWRRYGDRCLEFSPLRTGIIVSRSYDHQKIYVVQWDDGQLSKYLEHGIEESSVNSVIDWKNRAWKVACIAESAEAGHSAALEEVARLRVRIDWLEAKLERVRELSRRRQDIRPDILSAMWESELD